MNGNDLKTKLGALRAKPREQKEVVEVSAVVCIDVSPRVLRHEDGSKHLVEAAPGMDVSTLVGVGF